MWNQWVWKRLDIFLKVTTWFVQKKILDYILKAICNLIFPKCLVILGKWEVGRSEFNIWANFTNHFTLLCSIFIRVWRLTSPMKSIKRVKIFAAKAFFCCQCIKKGIEHTFKTASKKFGRRVPFNCESKNLIYVATGSGCKEEYIRQTQTMPKED